jgi:predicted small lipoprotein YifL
MGTNMPSHANRIIIVLLTLSSLCACGRPPAENASNSNSQKLPFDREPRSTGISPSQSLIPSTSKLPEGTAIAIRLERPLSSASSHAGDTFRATLDEPVVIDGRMLVARGTSATGRVLEAKPSASSRGSSLASSLEPGYLRIVLVSLNIGGRQVMIETSSIFVKGGSREDRSSATSVASGAGQKDKDIVFGMDRRLNFRLAQTVDLQ